MGRTLHDLADVCRSTGYPVVEVDGWPTNSRGGAGGDSTDGYESGAPNHIIVHHTASGPASDPMNGGGDVDYCAYGHQDSPVGNLYLSRDGTIYVMAGQAANTNGSGHDTCGIVSDDNMNAKSIAIEAGNNGVGEVWPNAQQDSYVKLVSALCNAYGIGNGQVHSHFEWAPGRKIDPAGQSAYASGADMWDMGAFRNDVAGGFTPPPQPEPGPEPEPTPPGEAASGWWNDLMFALPTVRKGDSGPFVKRMQHLLASNGFMNEANTANYDGVFGSGTDGALRKFQSAAGIASDGICGPITWGALMHTIDGIPTLDKGATGPDVKKMQHLLAAAGFMNEANVANYDGVWGNGTDGAKQKFDTAFGLLPSPPTTCAQKSWTRLLQG